MAPTKRVTRSSTRQAAQQVLVEPTPKMKKTKKVTFQKSNTIIIEHCIQCNLFKVSALKVKLGLETAVAGVTVHVNPVKPRRGCFEVREEGGKKFVSLLDMKLPYAPMKALDMDAVISDIIDQMQ